MASKGPKFITCYLCGQQYGSSSLPIHQQSCYKKKLGEWQNLPKDIRGPQPTHPLQAAAMAASQPAAAPAKGVSSNKAAAGGGKGSAGITSSSPRGGAAAPAPTGGLIACPTCGRKFNADRIEKHQSACQKVHTKREQFSSQKKRLEGTELEGAVIPTGPSSSAPPQLQHQQQSQRSSKKLPSQAEMWKREHQSFLNHIRKAKEAPHRFKTEVVIAVSESPPPPPPVVSQAPPRNSSTGSQRNLQQHQHQPLDMSSSKSRSRTSPSPTVAAQPSSYAESDSRVRTSHPSSASAMAVSRTVDLSVHSDDSVHRGGGDHREYGRPDSRTEMAMAVDRSYDSLMTKRGAGRPTTTTTDSRILRDESNRRPPVMPASSLSPQQQQYASPSQEYGRRSPYGDTTRYDENPRGFQSHPRDVGQVRQGYQGGQYEGGNGRSASQQLKYRPDPMVDLYDTDAKVNYGAYAQRMSSVGAGGAPQRPPPGAPNGRPSEAVRRPPPPSVENNGPRRSSAHQSDVAPRRREPPMAPEDIMEEDLMDPYYARLYAEYLVTRAEQSRGRISAALAASAERRRNHFDGDEGDRHLSTSSFDIRPPPPSRRPPPTTSSYSTSSQAYGRSQSHMPTLGYDRPYEDEYNAAAKYEQEYALRRHASDRVAVRQTSNTTPTYDLTGPTGASEYSPPPPQHYAKDLRRVVPSVPSSSDSERFFDGGDDPSYSYSGVGEGRRKRELFKF